jgi:two-component sensor histidine kinase
MLIKELQHRVKNSLTTAASLIGLERTNLSDARARSIFANTEARIQSMAMLYDQLNQGDHINHIDLRSYLQDLVKGLAQSYQAANSPVTIETRLDACQVQPDVALPVGLIVNELVTNALKYAFPHGQAGVIQVTLEENDGVKSLCVSDNGVGIAPTSSGRDRRGLGITLVEMFAGQLGGDLSITDGPGLTVRVTF